MKMPEGALEAAERFADGVIAQRWTDLVKLFAASVRSRHSAESLEAAFHWDHLGPRLRQMFIAYSGEPAERVPHLDPPQRFDAFELGDDYMGNPLRNPPEGFEVGDTFGWVQIDFQPSEDSDFDECCCCFLAFIEEDGPKIIHYEIDLVST